MQLSIPSPGYKDLIAPRVFFIVSSTKTNVNSFLLYLVYISYLVHIKNKPGCIYLCDKMLEIYREIENSDPTVVSSNPALGHQC